MRLNLQAKKDASSSLALVLIGVAAVLCSAFIPHVTTPRVASRLVEVNHPDACPRHQPPRSRCYRWALTHCAAHPEARCVATQATHRVGTRCVTWLPLPWAMAKGFHGPEACV